MSVNTEVKGIVETECAVRRLSDELRRVRTVAIFLAKGVMRMQQARQEALALSAEDCKDYLVREFPILQGPKAESVVSRFAQLEDVAAERAEDKHLGKAGNREHDDWIAVTSRYPGAQPYTWSRSVLVLLDTGGVTISSYFDRQNLEGQWLNLEEGFGTVTHWHELPPLPSEAEQKVVLTEYEKLHPKKENKAVVVKRRWTSRSSSRRRIDRVEEAQPYAQPFKANEKSAPVQDNEVRWI